MLLCLLLLKKFPGNSFTLSLKYIKDLSNLHRCYSVLVQTTFITCLSYCNSLLCGLPASILVSSLFSARQPSDLLKCTMLSLLYSICFNSPSHSESNLKFLQYSARFYVPWTVFSHDPSLFTLTVPNNVQVVSFLFLSISGKLPPASLFTTYLLCLECLSPRYSHGSLLHCILVFIHMLIFQWDL